MKGLFQTPSSLLLATAFFASNAMGQPPPAPPAAAAKRIYRIAVSGPIDTMDPVAAETNAELMLVSNVVETLVTRDRKTGLLIPSAAEKYSLSEDGLTITFTLRPDLFWSNGEKIKAEDFVYSLRRLLSAPSDAWMADYLTSIKGAEDYHAGAMMESKQLGIQAKNDRTFVVTLAEAQPFMLDFFAQPATAPVHKETIERNQSNWWLPEHWVGNGPFIPVQKKELQYVFQKNPHHRWVSKILLDEVQVNLVGSREEGARMYAEQKIDQFGYRDYGVPGEFLTAWIGKKDLVFEPDLRTLFLRLNTAKAPLSQLKLRQALAMAIDRQTLLEGVGLSGERSALSLVPDGVNDYENPKGYLFNVPGARQIFRDLGYCTKGSSLTGCKSPPSLALIHRDGKRNRKVALAVDAIWKKQLGLSGLSIRALSPDEFARKIRSGDYLVALDDLAVLPEKPFAFLEMFKESREGDHVFDQLLDAAFGSPSWSEARGYLRRAEAMLLREGGIVPLFHDSTVLFLSPKIAGFFPNLWGVHPFSDISLSP